MRELNQIADLALRVGEVLMASGAGAADVTFTTLSVNLPRADEADAPVVLIRGVKRRAWDYDALASSPPWLS